MSMKLLVPALALVFLAACETGSNLDDGKADGTAAATSGAQAAKQDKGVDSQALALRRLGGRAGTGDRRPGAFRL